LFTLRAKVVVNATGVFADSIRQLDNPAAEPLLAVSQGIHLVFDRGFLKGNTALMVPRARDGHVLFVLPWHGHCMVGTTNTPVGTPHPEPRPLDDEIDSLLESAARYLTRPPTRADIKSVFAGLRPMVRGPSGKESNTPLHSQSHLVHVDPSGLLTITGGSWATYRSMAADCVDHALPLGQLPTRPSVTKTLRIHGYRQDSRPSGTNPSHPELNPLHENVDAHPVQPPRLQVYGSDADSIRALAHSNPALQMQLHPSLPIVTAEIVWAARHEMARTVEDALARHTRALFLNARAASAMAEPVARLMADELGRDQCWIAEQITEFTQLAEQYQVAKEAVCSDC